MVVIDPKTEIYVKLQMKIILLMEICEYIYIYIYIYIYTVLNNGSSQNLLHLFRMCFVHSKMNLRLIEPNKAFMKCISYHEFQLLGKLEEPILDAFEAKIYQ